MRRKVDQGKCRAISIPSRGNSMVWAKFLGWGRAWPFQRSKMSPWCLRAVMPKGWFMGFLGSIRKSARSKLCSSWHWDICYLLSFTVLTFTGMMQKQRWVKLLVPYQLQAFPGGPDGKESACNAGDPGSIPGLGR